MISMENFVEYSPSDNDLDESLISAKRAGGIFIRDDKGRDFYKSKSLFLEHTLKVVYDSDKNVVIIKKNIDDTFPVGRSVIEIEDQEYDDSRVYKIDTDKRVLVLNTQLENRGKKQRLIDDADSVIQPLLGYAVSGILSDTEKETFKAWNEYRKALEDVDVTADDIQWPDKPQ